MSETSPALGLPYIQPSQAQKHVTHNEALRVLDAVTQLSVLSADLATPPADPATGARYIVAAPGQDAWAAQDHAIALYTGSTWEFFTPLTGWRADVAPTGVSLRFDGTTWQGVTMPATLPQLGLNTSADATNRLAVAADATLLTHDGAGHQLKINKDTGTDTASLLFQTGWSGRAEMGTAGSDDFAIKTSADGATFNDALVASAATGAVQMPSGQLFFRDLFVSDDDVTSFDIPFGDPARILMWLAADIPGHHYLLSITGALSGAVNFAQIFASAPGALHFQGGALTGTSGPDAGLSLSIDTGGANPRMYLENRLGVDASFALATLGK